MKAILDTPSLRRITHPTRGYGDAYNGAAILRTRTGALRIIFSAGEGWDHVSVSRADRCPTWEEMCCVCDAFFEAEDCVVQFHPPKSDYVNLHPYCLHLWRKQADGFPMPPIEFV